MYQVTTIAALKEMLKMTAFINGNIITLDGNKVCEAFYIENSIFKAVGTTDEILKFAKLQGDIVDLKGKTVVPGFNDAHMHFLMYAVQKNNVNLLNVPSIDNMVSLSIEYIKNRSIPSEEWINF